MDEDGYPMLRPWPHLYHCVALCGLLLLSGCSGFGVFLDDTHSFTAHVNRPIGNSETIRRVEGKPVVIQPLVAEAGNVWPGPVPPEPTLEDLQNAPAKPLPDLEGATQPSLSNVPSLNIPVIPHHLQPRPGEDAGVLGGPLTGTPGSGHIPSSAIPQAASPQGTIVPTPRGNEVETRTPSGIPQAHPPGMPGGITVPNGDGTSTVIAPNGTITTVPTPK